MIPYYSPHFGLIDLLKTFFCFNAEAELEEKFRKLTGKKYILFTASCRSALYLAYKAIGETGLVHTSPLTCQVAILPIWASGNETSFQDVKADDWTLDPEAVKKSITSDSIAIQAIHLGGFLCDVPALKAIADENDLVLIEDCAQGFGGTFDGVPTGVLGDIACFTLTKNLYSLGGGVLATDNRQWFHAAKEHQKSFPKVSFLRLSFRVLITLLSSHRHLSVVEKLYQFFKNASKSKSYEEQESALNKELKQVPRLYLKSCAARWDKIQKLVKINKETARETVVTLKLDGVVWQHNPRTEPSYTKLFLALGQDSPQFIEMLNNNGVETMHLEHKHKVYYQEKLFEGEAENYHRLHDRMVSLPGAAATKVSDKSNNTIGTERFELKRIIIEIGHPAHVHHFKNLYWELEKRGWKGLFVSKDKECAIDLLKSYNLPYAVLGTTKQGIVAKLLSLPGFALRMFSIAKEFKPDVFISRVSPLSGWSSRLLKKPHITFTDTENVKKMDLISEPFADVVLTSDVYQREHGRKQIRYPGYHELAYLHPNRFTPDPSVLSLLGIQEGESYAIVRFVAWTAHHDVGLTGMALENKIKLVNLLSKHLKVFISSEGEPPQELEQYKISIPAERMHDALYYAHLFVGESATMASECAVFGTPALYMNSVRFGSTDDQIKFGLLEQFSSSPEDQEAMIKRAVEIGADAECKRNFVERQRKMLGSKIDVTAFMLWFVENYPKSRDQMRKRGFNFDSFR